MKTKLTAIVAAFVVAAASALSGCSTWDKLGTTERGAVAGGAIGSGVGAIVGNQSGHPGTGTAIGGAAGALSGGLIGRGMENNDRDRYDGRGRLRSCPAGEYYDYASDRCLSRRSEYCPRGQYYDQDRDGCYYYEDRY